LEGSCAVAENVKDFTDVQTVGVGAEAYGYSKLQAISGFRRRNKIDVPLKKHRS
jgi:hypothetical protein